jgi:hypothetical protein
MNRTLPVLIATGALLAVIALSPTQAGTALSTGFSFQGRLLDGGTPVDDTVNLTFSLWDAETSGTQIGTDDAIAGVTVTDGFVNALLNDADEFGSDAFIGEARWIEVDVDGVTLSPRFPVTATPHAMSLAPGARIEGSGDAFTVSSSGSGSRTIVGLSTSGGANTAGVYGEAAATGGRGVHGEATSTTGATAGVRGVSLSNNSNATGVFGLMMDAAATGAGVKGQNNGTSGYGVWGQGGANAHGVLGQTNGSSAYGVWAYNSGTGVALRAEGSGNLIEAWSQSPVNVRFRVDNSGNVTADGTYTSPAADFAEMLPASGELEAGDVLVVSRDGTLTRSTEPFQPTVAGIHSTKPAFLGGMVPGVTPENDVPLAVVGIVPVKASTENGPITPGAMLVASSTPGHAMAGGANPPQGTVVGKALSGLESGTGTIRVLVILQ